MVPANGRRMSNSDVVKRPRLFVAAALAVVAAIPGGVYLFGSRTRVDSYWGRPRSAAAGASSGRSSSTATATAVLTFASPIPVTIGRSARTTGRRASASTMTSTANSRSNGATACRPRSPSPRCAVGPSTEGERPGCRMRASASCRVRSSGCTHPNAEWLYAFDAILEILEFPGFIIGTLIAAAVLWWLGLRQPFLLTLCALVLGGGAGTFLEWRLTRTKPRTPPS